MNLFPPAIAARIIFILGVTNLVTGLLVLSTCRCIPGLKITGRLMQHAAYKRFYKYHCYIWWVFWVSVIVHAFLAIGLLGFPF
ncbi:hypothetical protein ACFLV1_01025 [Chloroflexota bacterium]